MARERRPSACRGRLVAAAVHALSVLTEVERRFVEDLDADQITEQGCLLELIERRFGRYA